MTALVAAPVKADSIKETGSRAFARATPAPRPVFEPPVMIQRKCACGGSCARCEEEKQKNVQMKLRVNAPGDAFEREADRVADQVVAMPAAQLKAFPQDASPQDASPHGTAPAADATAGSLGAGSPLDRSTRAFMESRFGAGFEQVRVHHDAAADASARSVNALAYTVGNDIVFADGQYSPASTEGRRLLAHELTHVIQQSSGMRLVQRQAGPGIPSAASPPAVCPSPPTGLGSKEPAPPCPKPVRDIGAAGKHFHFCADSDVLTGESAADVSAFVDDQEADAQFVVHGYASMDGGLAYNQKLACHRANRIAALLREDGVSPDRIEVGSKGATSEFGPKAENEVAVVVAEVPPERRFGRFRPDPECPKAPTGLGDVRPDPPCPEDPIDLETVCENLDPAQRSRECDIYNFCVDSDIFLFPETPGTVMKFARKQPAKAVFTVHGYASEEGVASHHDYNVRLACHRAKRVARELMKAGVPPEQIRIASRGPTTQFPGGPEFNRVAVVRAAGPNAGAAPSFDKPKTPADRRAMLDAAIARINLGTYRLEADAYISFWTCGRVPTIRDAVNITTFYIAGEPGVPSVEESKKPLIIGRVEGLDLNSAIIAKTVFDADNGDLRCIMGAVTALSFVDKGRDEDFGTDRGRGSDRGKAGIFLHQLAGLACVDEDNPNPDPRADSPAPDCLKVPGPTFKGAPAPGELGARVPDFVVDEFSVRSHSGPSLLLRPLPGNQASLETPVPAFESAAKITLHGQPGDFAQYDIGFVLTATEDSAEIAYDKGETIRKRVPTPIRVTDALGPREPWFSEGSFDSPKQGHVKVSMSRTEAQTLPLNFVELSGKSTTPGGALTTVARHAEYQLWVVARRRGAPLDRFSTHFLAGTKIDFDQSWDDAAKPGSGKFKSNSPIGGSNPDVVRFTGPTPDDLEARETSTTNVMPPCAKAFGQIDFDVNDDRATGTSNGAIISRPNPHFVVVGGDETKTSPVDYKPTITAKAKAATAPFNKFEAGLIQNLLSIEDEYHYSTGQVVHKTCSPPPPLRDGASPNDPATAAVSDPAFMANVPPVLDRFSIGRRQVNLRQVDRPSGGAFLSLSDEPTCPKPGTLTRAIVKREFRTWLVIRFDKDDSCVLVLSHNDWHTDFEADVTKNVMVKKDLVVTEAHGDGKKKIVIGGEFPNDVCQGDDACV